MTVRATQRVDLLDRESERACAEHGLDGIHVAVAITGDEHALKLALGGAEVGTRHLLANVVRLDRLIGLADALPGLVERLDRLLELSAERIELGLDTRRLRLAIGQRVGPGQLRDRCGEANDCEQRQPATPGRNCAHYAVGYQPDPRTSPVGPLNVVGESAEFNQVHPTWGVRRPVRPL